MPLTKDQQTILKSAIKLDLHAVFSKYGCIQPFVAIDSMWGGKHWHITASGVVPIIPPIDPPTSYNSTGEPESDKIEPS